LFPIYLKGVLLKKAMTAQFIFQSKNSLITENFLV